MTFLKKISLPVLACISLTMMCGSLSAMTLVVDPHHGAPVLFDGESSRTIIDRLTQYDGFMLSECTCRALQRTPSVIDSRTLFENYVVQGIGASLHHHTRYSTFSYVSFGAGFLFLDLMILGKLILTQPLIANGSISLCIHAIDPIYNGIYKEQSLGQKLMLQLVGILQNTFKNASISGSTYLSYQDFRAQNIQPHVVIAADIETAHSTTQPANPLSEYMAFLHSTGFPPNYLLRGVRRSSITSIPLFRQYNRDRYTDFCPIAIEPEQECC